MTVRQMNKRNETWLQSGNSNAKRPRTDSVGRASTSGYSSFRSDSIQYLGTVSNYDNSKNDHAETDDLDDDFFLTQADEIQRLEEMATQKIKVRETHQVAPGFSLRPVQPKYVATPPRDSKGGGRDALSEHFLPADQMISQMSRLNQERERSDSEKKRLEDELMTKNGEIDLLRSRNKELEKNQMTIQLKLMNIENDFVGKLAALEKKNASSLERLRSEMEFASMEKNELERKLQLEHIQKEKLERRLESMKQINASARENENRRDSRLISPDKRNITGPKFSSTPFPDRRSFYDNSQKPCNDSRLDHSAKTDSDAEALAATKSRKPQMASISRDDHGVQTERVLVAHVRRFSLSGRVREKKPPTMCTPALSDEVSQSAATLKEALHRKLSDTSSIPLVK